MLIYEKWIDSIRHLFGSPSGVPSDEDVEMTYVDEDGGSVELTNLSQLRDDKQGGMTLAGVNIKAFVGTEQIIPAVKKEQDKTVIRIELATNFKKSKYLTDDFINTSGLSLNVTYSDDSTEVVNEGYTISPTTASTLGEMEVTVFYKGKTCATQIEVVEPVVVESAEDLQEALSSGEYVSLSVNITSTAKLSITKDTEIDLNGHELKCSSTKARVIEVTNGGSCSVKNGTIVGSSTSASYPPVFVGANSSIELTNCTVTSAGKEIIKTNGKESGVNITLNDCTLEGRSYLPAEGTYVFKNCTMVGYCCALYIKSGKFIIDGGHYESTGTDGDWFHSSNGYCSTGDAIIIEACNYPNGNAEVTIVNDPEFVTVEPKSSEYNTYNILAIDWRQSETEEYPTSAITSCIGYRHGLVTGYSSLSGPYYHFTNENTEFVEPTV